MLRAIVFDAYGTLISTGDGSVRAAGEILRRNGRGDVEPKAFYARWKQLHREHMDAPGGFVREETIFRMDLRRLYAEYAIDGDSERDVQVMLDTLGRRSAFPEAREVLERLGERFEVCIGSTTDTKPLMQDVRRNALTVRRVFTSEMLRTYKPQAEFYRKILTEMGVSAAETLFVGDSLLDDVTGPRRVGMKTCWVNRKCAAVKDAAPDYVISNLRELYGICEGEDWI